ncbi:MAG: hypothetical protein WA584_02860 [Pyrinomonadaceae bacterium]
MKRILLLSFLLIITLSNVQAQSVELPDSCKKLLDKNYQGWKPAPIQKDITDYFRGKNLSNQLNLVKGDWNGDGKMDYAALIKHGKSKNEAGEIIGDRRLTIAFVSRRKGYRHFSFDGGDYIVLMKKGSEDYDYNTDKKFRYRTDAIFDGIWEKAGVSYVWKNGKFIEIITSD